MKNPKTVFVFVACFVFLLGGCSVIPDKPFRHKDFVDRVGEQNLYVIEYGDDGYIHLPLQLERLQDDVRKGVTERDILLFVHGWRHNASKDDARYGEFRDFVSGLNAGEKKYTGVYVGWRGAQKDLFGFGSILGIDFPTFGERKDVAAGIGKNGLYDLMDTLNESISSGHIDRFVAIGHDLGGASVFHASKGRLENWNTNLFVLLDPAITGDEYSVVSEIRQSNDSFPKLITLRGENDYAGALFINPFFVGKDAVVNNLTITHDLDACATGEKYCRAYLRVIKTNATVIDDCITVLNDDLWKITARDNNGPGRETCQDANKFAGWVISTGPNSAGTRRAILTEQQASGLKEILDATHSGNKK